MSLYSYPAEIVAEILGWLKVEDCRQFACCSKNSYLLVKKQLWRRVKLDMSDLYDRKEVDQFIKYIDLTSELSIKGTNWVIPEEERQVFDNLEYVLEKCDPAKIKSFELLHGCYSSLEDLLCAHLSRFTNLVELSLDTFPLDDVLEEISLLPNLQSLVIKGDYYRLPEAGLWELVNLKRLRKLGIHNRETYWDISKVICEMKGLVEVDLTRTEVLDWIVINICNSLINLQVLNIGGCTSLRNDCLSSLYRLTSLRKLSIGGLFLVNEKIFCHVLAVPSLKCLDITSFGTLSAHGMSLLGEMGGLEELILARCSFEDNDLVHLTKLERLLSLNVNKCKELTNKGVEHIAQLKSLRRLHMFGCPLVTEVGSLSNRVFIDYSRPNPRCFCMGLCCCDKNWN